MNSDTDVLKACIDLDHKYIGISSRASYYPCVIESAKGVKVTDVNGIEYIDMFSSAAVMNTGYNHPHVVSKVIEQIEKYTHFTNDYMYSMPQVFLAEKLANLVPGDYDKKVVFGFSGSDGVDASIKLARNYTGRSKIISFTGAYHGSTYGAISVSTIGTNMKRGIGPLLPEVYHLRFPITESNEDEKKTSDNYFKEFLDAFEFYIPVEEVAAVIIEPIAGDLGFLIPPTDFMRRLSEFTKANGIMLIADEVQQGFGRTGKWFSFEHFGIVPDIVVLGKAIASGFPLSAVVAASEVVDSLNMPGHLFTLQGSPVSVAASLATIDVIEDERLIDRAVVVGDYIVKRFREIGSLYGNIKTIRGLGLSIGVELEGSEPGRNIASKIIYRLYERGILLIYLNGNVLRVQPPLIISDQEIRQAMDLIEDVFREYSEGLIPDEVLKKVKGW